MFMRFVGGGIGHKASDHMQQSTPTTTACIQDKGLEAHWHDEDIIHPDAQGHSQEEVNAEEDPEESDAHEDPEEVDADEEADYRYADDFEIEGEDNDSELESEEDGNDEYDVL